jgi:hypothetical protein
MHPKLQDQLGAAQVIVFFFGALFYTLSITAHKA